MEASPEETHPGPPAENADGEAQRVAWAVGLLAMTLLAYELVATRLFSVILWNHFAFLAISVGLFGLGVAGVAVYVFPQRFRRERARGEFERSLALLPTAILLSVIVICALPIRMNFAASMFGYLALIFAVTAVPFAVGGIALSLGLTHWPHAVNRIYAFDLVGSALGCGVVIAMLGWLDGPTAAMALAAIPVVALMIMRPSGIALGILATIILMVAANAHFDIVRITVSRSGSEAPAFERWNAYSRVTVLPNTHGWSGWGTSSRSTAPALEAYGIEIDGDAFTPVHRFDGDLAKLTVLLDDITAVGYAVAEPGGAVLVIGAGGGRDVLTALAAGMAKVRAVEVNPIIANDIVNGAFRDFAGGLYDHPRVDLVVGEGRSVVEHDDARYDVVQVSMVDTSAASAAGAYALTENALYTSEAAESFLAHLEPDGLFTSTWANFENLEGANRLVGLYAHVLREGGYDDIGRRIAIIAEDVGDRQAMRLATVLVKPSGFTQPQARRLIEWTRSKAFIPLHLPGLRVPSNPAWPEIDVMRTLIEGEELERFFDAYRLDLRPVDDDRPFFFYQNRWRDLGAALTTWQSGTLYGNGMFILAKLLVISGVAVLLFLFAPLAVRGLPGREQPGVALPFAAYFTCLGAGFITVEIAAIQMFGYYLGHPLLGLGVSLSSLLLFTGLGSGLGARWSDAELAGRAGQVIAGAILLCATYAVVVPMLTELTLASPTPLRAAVVVAVLAPLGLLLGLPLPTGLRMLGESSALTPWMWAINSGASVFGTTLATLVVLHVGFSRTLLLGAAVYALALVALWRMQRVLRATSP